MGENRLSRRTFLKSIGAVAGLAALSACSTTSQKPTATVPAGKQSATLTFASPVWGEYLLPAYNNLLASYQERNPHIKIEPSLLGWGALYDKITAQLAAGAPFDVAYMEPDFAFARLAKDVVLDIHDYIIDDVNFDEWYKTPWEVCKNLKDRYVGVPITFNAEHALWYNKTLLEKNGIPVPTPDWTYDDLIGAAKKLTIFKDNLPVQLGLGVRERFSHWIYAAGGDVWDKEFDYKNSVVDSDQAVEAMQFLKDLVLKDKVLPVPGTVEGGEGSFWMGGKMGFNLNGTWLAQSFASAKLEFEWDVQLAPKHPKTGLRPSRGASGAFYIFKGTKHPQQAWDFLKAINVTDEGQRSLAAFMETPAKKTVIDNYYVPTFLTKTGVKNSDAILKALENPHMPIGILNVAQWRGQELMDMLQTLYTEDADPRTVLSQIKTRTMEIYREVEASLK